MQKESRPTRPIFKVGHRYRALRYYFGGLGGAREGEILEYKCHDYSVYDGAFFYHFISVVDGREVRWCLDPDAAEDSWRSMFEELPEDPERGQ
jgi:hypothetical protein